MTDIIIQDVPIGAESKVKELAMVAIERFLKQQDLQVAPATMELYKTKVDSIYKNNGLKEKYKIEVEEKPEKPEEILKE